MTQLIKTPALTVDFKEDLYELEASGALSKMVYPIIRKINERLRDEKPAMVRENDLVISTWIPPIPSGPFRRLLLNEAKIAIGRPIPQTVTIEVTRECGCSCDHCNVREGDRELDRADIERVIEEAQELGASIITFTEGDPLLRDDIYDLIRHVDPELSVVNLFTPGMEMTMDKALMLKEAGLYNLLIGVYSTDSEVHDQIRGVAGAQKKAIEAINYGVKAGLLVTMATHVNSKRVDEIPDLYGLASHLGVQELSLWEAIPRSAEDSLTQIDREKILLFYKRMNSNPKGPRVFASTYFEGEMLGCMAGRRWLHVAVDGSVRACPYLEESYGNVMESSLKNIWRDIRSSGDFDGSVNGCPAQKIFLPS